VKRPGFKGLFIGSLLVITRVAILKSSRCKRLRERAMLSNTAIKPKALG